MSLRGGSTRKIALKEWPERAGNRLGGGFEEHLTCASPREGEEVIVMWTWQDT